MKLDLVYRELKKRRELSNEQKIEADKLKGTFERQYQRWYTQASAVVRQLLSDRAAEFNMLYMGDGKRKDVNSVTYTIQDWLNGIRAGTYMGSSKKHFDDFGAAFTKFITQLRILESVEARFETKLIDIERLVQADLFDTELESARELLKHGFVRAAGAIAGVVLEKHLLQVAVQHNIKIRKRNPNISDLNDLLKNEDVLDTPVWRQIQRLGDIRNLCSHNKDRSPSNEEAVELIEGVDNITKTLF